MVSLLLAGSKNIVHEDFTGYNSLVYSVCHVLALGAGLAISFTVDMVDSAAIQNSRTIAGISLQTH